MVQNLFIGSNEATPMFEKQIFTIDKKTLSAYQQIQIHAVLVHFVPNGSRGKEAAIRNKLIRMTDYDEMVAHIFASHRRPMEFIHLK